MAGEEPGLRSQPVSPPQRPWLLRGTVLALAIGVGLAAWILGERNTDTASAPLAARIVHPGELTSVAAALGYPVYWAGPRPGSVLELIEVEGGGVQIRYLEEGAEPGGEAADALVVGTYPLADPRAALERFAADPGSTVRRSRQGLEVHSAAANPGSVYFADPGNSVQVEIYDPSPERALRLALSGRVRPAG